MAEISVAVVESLNLGSPGSGVRPVGLDSLRLSGIHKAVLPKITGALSLDLEINNPKYGFLVDTLDLADTKRPGTQIQESYAYLMLTETIDTDTSILANPERVAGGIGFSEIVTWNRAATRIDTEGLAVTEYVLPYIERGGVPMVIVEGTATPITDTYAPIISQNSRFNLMRTYYGINEVTMSLGSLSVTLPAPTFNNTHSIQSTRIQRESISGKLIIHRVATWPQVESFSWSFEGLTEAQKDDFLDFIYSTLGLEIRVLDYEGRDWVGVISNPEVETSEELRTCGYKVNLEFEGEIYDPD
jgi:hypothetical protein